MKYLIILFLFCFFTSAGPAYAQTSPPEYPPHLTLQAPFDYSGGEVKDMTLLGIEGVETEEVQSLDAAHRSTKDIGAWVMKRAAEVLTFEGSSFDEDTKQRKIYFSNSGHEQYMEFLKKEGLIRAIESGSYDIKSFAQSIPVLLNEDSVNKRYRWLYEVPVMVTFINKQAKDYRRAQSLNKALMLTLQVGRVKETEDGENIVIERWRAVPQQKPSGK